MKEVTPSVSWCQGTEKCAAYKSSENVINCCEQVNNRTDATNTSCVRMCAQQPSWAENASRRAVQRPGEFLNVGLLALLWNG